VLAYCDSLKRDLEAIPYANGRLRVQIDDRDIRGGEKAWHHVKRGVPLRAEIGPKDIAQDAVFLCRRDTGTKASTPRAQFIATVSQTLDEIQANLFQRALKLRQDNTVTIDSLADFQAYFTPKNEERPEIHGGFALCHFSDDPAVDRLLKDMKVTIRCIPLEGDKEPGRCVISGQPSSQRAVFAKAY
jgi:prolyl-tRNA synthetase